MVGVSFVVKQRQSEEMKVWEREETSVAGAEWVKRRRCGGLRAQVEGLCPE